MSDEELTEQVVTAMRASGQRFKAKHPQAPDEHIVSAVAEFMSGANQLANFLVRADGEVTAQQLERALFSAGKRLGFQLGRPQQQGGAA